MEKDSLFFKSLSEAHTLPGSSVEFSIGGKPIPIPHVRLKDSESFGSVSPNQGQSVGKIKLSVD